MCTIACVILALLIVAYLCIRTTRRTLPEAVGCLAAQPVVEEADSAEQPAQPVTGEEDLTEELFADIPDSNPVSDEGSEQLATALQQVRWLKRSK